MTKQLSSHVLRRTESHGVRADGAERFPYEAFRQPIAARLAPSLAESTAVEDRRSTDFAVRQALQRNVGLRETVDVAVDSNGDTRRQL